MRVHVVSDVHGASEALSRAADGSDLFICLGDLLLYLEYDDPTQGAFSEIFGPEVTAEYIALRTAKRFDASRELVNTAWARVSGDSTGTQRRGVLTEIIERQYSELFAAMPSPALLTPGNVDVPALWPKYVRPGQQILDGQAVEVNGVTFGFVGGGLISPYRTPNEVLSSEFAAKVEALAALGNIDVLCSHIPPAIAELTYDVVSRRFEVGSAALYELIMDTQPPLALFGHVHQPLASRMRIGRTECVNVGHFRANRRPFVVDI